MKFRSKKCFFRHWKRDEKKEKKSALNNISKNSISPDLSQMNSLLKGCKISLSLQQKQSQYGAPF